MIDLVKTICRKERIAGERIQALTGGQINAVFLVDDHYVVRIGGREDAGQRLARETGLLQNLAGRIPVAQVLAFGEAQGHFYQIQTFMPGKKLYAVWKEIDAEGQEAIAAELAAALKVLHSFRYPDFGDGQPGGPRYAVWGDYLAEKLQETIAELRELKIRMAPGSIEMAEEYFEAHRCMLQDGVATLVHCDLTMVNLLAEHGKLTAILDFELATQAPADYELQTIEAFCLYPNDWAEEDNEFFCTADFANLVPLLRKHYPELFAIPNLRERVNVYHLYAALHSYLAWRKANLNSIPPEEMAAKSFYMGRITNILYRNGARMFFA